MKNTRLLTIVVAAFAVFWMAGLVSAQGQPPGAVPMDTGFTYQGRLDSSGAPYTGVCDMQFGLYDALSGGTLVDTLALESVPVEDGIFTVQLDYNAGIFTGERRWLEIGVKCGADSEFTILAPRQPLSASPYAIYSMNAGALDGIPANAFWNSGNDGAGSGLDADLLDGRQGSEYLVGRPVFSRSTVSIGTYPGYTSITTGIDGLGLISYKNDYTDDLEVAHCKDTACTSADVYTLDNNGDVGMYSSITIGADGLGLISYYDETNGDLKAAHCVDIPCSSAEISTLDSNGDVGMYSSITIGADGMALISYYDDEYVRKNLKIAHCLDTACTSANTYTLDDLDVSVGYYSSITTGVDGLGLISYACSQTRELKVAHCLDTDCSSATISVLDSDVQMVYSTSITIGSDGLGLISYYDNAQKDLKIAHCADTECSSANIYTLDSDGSVGLYASITIGADGLGLISYLDATNKNLKVAHCSNQFCIPYVRQR